ncbi:hypothetical protein LTR08_006896 [Meristemomyces frigidus]|nr:hypothetical protein LTR08_006896 [Meristemomyces frigidus]
MVSEHVAHWVETHPPKREPDERFASQKLSVISNLRAMLSTLPSINRPTLHEDHGLGELVELIDMLKTRIENQDMRKYAFKHGPVTPLPAPRIVEVSDVKGMRDMISLLLDVLENTNLMTLYLDFRGHHLGRNGALHVLQIYCLAVETVWFIHVSQLGAAVFDISVSSSDTLRGILESTQIRKVFWDCRGASDALFCRHGIRLCAASIVDLQLLYCAVTKKAEMRARLKSVAAAVGSCINLPYEEEKEWFATREEGKLVATEGPNWKEKRDREGMVPTHQPQAKWSADPEEREQAVNEMEEDCGLLEDGWTVEGAWGMMPLPNVMTRYAVGELVVLPLVHRHLDQHARLTSERKLAIKDETAKRIEAAHAEDGVADDWDGPEGWAAKGWGEPVGESEEDVEGESGSESTTGL